MLQLLGRLSQASAGSACGTSLGQRLKGTHCLQDVETGKVQERQYGSVIAACGHHWDPLWPELTGEFKGTMIHAHSYRSPKPFEGRRVLIIGGGNSGGVFLQITWATLPAGVWHVVSLRRHKHVYTSSPAIGMTCTVHTVGADNEAGMRSGASAGMDIAAELAQSGAARILLSCRRRVHVVPRYTFGKPTDTRLKPWCLSAHPSLPLPGKQACD